MSARVGVELVAEDVDSKDAISNYRHHKLFVVIKTRTIAGRMVTTSATLTQVKIASGLRQDIRSTLRLRTTRAGARNTKTWWPDKFPE
jgi:hypothetical protein